MILFKGGHFHSGTDSTFPYSQFSRSVKERTILPRYVYDIEAVRLNQFRPK